MTDTMVSVIVPVYNEALGIDEFHRRAQSALDVLPDADYELIFVDDGSHDGSFQKLQAIAEANPQVRVIKLSRNFGHQIAITAGLDLARGDCGVVIDADLQDPPEVIVRMVEQWRQGFDVVYGVRNRRKGEQWFKLFTAGMFYRVLRRIVKIDIPVDAGDFRLMSRRAIVQLQQLREKDRFVRGLVSWIGFKQTGISYDRDERFAGETKYPFRKMLRFAIDGITSFSTLPLKLSMWLGYAASAFAFLYLASVFVQKFYLGITVEGWATIMVAMMFLGGVQLICLGILGEYIGRIFTEIKPRPMYIIETQLGSESTQAQPRDSAVASTAP